MCMIDGGEPTIGWREVHRRARKPHHCGECGRSIAEGELYWVATGVSDHRGFTAKTCEHCHVVSDWLSANCLGYIYREQIEDFSQHAEACMPMLRIVVGARRSWKSFSGDGLLPVPTYPGDMT